MTYLGQEFRDIEVCFYPYDMDDPYSGFIGTTYDCEPLTDDTRTSYFPAGYFFRRGRELVSAHHGVYRRDQKTGDEMPRVPPVKWPISAAALLDLSGLQLQQDEHFSLIIANTPVTRLSVLPVKDAKAEIVPARTPIMVAVVRKDRPVAVSRILDLDRYETRKLTRLDGGGVFFRFALEGGASNGRKLRMTIGHLPIPGVVLVDRDGTEHRPAWSPTFPGSVNGNLYFFRDVPEGEAVLRCSGRGWETVIRRIHVRPRLTVIEEVVTLQAAGR